MSDGRNIFIYLQAKDASQIYIPDIYFITLYNVQTDRIGLFVVRCFASDDAVVPAVRGDSRRSLVCFSTLCLMSFHSLFKLHILVGLLGYHGAWV